MLPSSSALRFVRFDLEFVHSAAPAVAVTNMMASSYFTGIAKFLSGLLVPSLSIIQ